MFATIDRVNGYLPPLSFGALPIVGISPVAVISVGAVVAIIASPVRPAAAVRSRGPGTDRDTLRHKASRTRFSRQMAPSRPQH